MHRRHFLHGCGALSAAAALGQMALFSPRAMAATSDYKALVCVFLFGGNDGNNTLVPIDSAGYANYAAVRGQIALPQASLVPLQETSGSAGFGLHPDLSALQSLWEAQQLGIVLNAGTLVQPLTKASYAASNTLKPESLFSHIDQQGQWQASVSTEPSRTGWGGRLTETLASLNSGSSLPAMISASGPQLFVTGAATSALTVPVSGSFALNGFNGSAGANSRLTALHQLLGLDSDEDLVAAAGDITTTAIADSAIVGPLLTASNTESANAFSGLTSGVALQLLAVSKLIEARATLGLSRQIFMVALGSFDTHTNELNQQSALFQQLGPALAAFQKSMAALGVANQVTTFTLSDFSRTFAANTAGGTDHAWGNHHFIMGGAVKGQAYYGTYPTLAIGGPDDVGTGRWIPTISVDQYAATLATWFGLAPASLPTVLPNIGAFPVANLGFMNA
jgi:uncharacterized protein (DUF1501 family)